MDTAIYYGLSTVAQVLASAFGFLVAVALYRIQFVSESIRILEGRRGKALQNMERSAGNVPEHVTQHYWSIVKSQEEEGAKISSVKTRLRLSMFWTAGTIIACVVLIPFTPLFTGRGLWVPWVSLCGVVAAAVYTLTTYVGLASEVTK